MSVKKLSRYDLVAVIAQGQLGPVWEGFDPDIRRKVTIKVAPVEHLSQQAADTLVGRFRAEARVAGKLVHPNIVGVYDAGVESGLAYIVAETVSGATLDALLRQPGGVPQELVGRVVLQVLAALDHAHSKGVVHRGLQPLQVLVTPSGSVKVADFGAVAVAEPDDATRSQGSLSEPIRCLAPEQVLGLEADAPADLWAVGVMLYRLWTGHWPFNADSDFGLIQQIIKQAPAAPSTCEPGRVPPLGPEHDQLIARALAKSAADRYPSAREFAADLSRIVAREAASGTLGGTAAGRAAVLNAVAAAAATPAAVAQAPLPEPVLAAVVAAATVAADDDSTRVFPRPMPAVPPPAVAPTPVVATASPATAPKRGWIVALGALLVVGAGAAFMMRRGAPLDVAAPAAPAASAVLAAAPPVAASAADPVASAAAAAGPEAASAVAVASGPAPAASSAAASAPAMASSVAAPLVKPLTPRELAAARRAVAEAAAKAKAKGGSAVVAVEPPARPVEDERPRAAPAPVAEAPKPVEAPASAAAPVAPTEPCGKRVFVARLACMKESCAKAEWARHPQCVEWRRMEEARQRGEQQN